MKKRKSKPSPPRSLPVDLPQYHQLPKELIGHPIRIELIGCGGTGCQMLTGLARLHLALLSLGHPGLDLTIYDPDIVTHANLGRQLFSPSDIGQHKAIVLTHRINQYFGIHWRARPVAWPDQRPEHDDPHIVISCTDTRASRRRIHKEILSTALYWLDLGNSPKSAQVILGQVNLPDGPGCIDAISWRQGERPPLVGRMPSLPSAVRTRFRQLPTVTELFPDLLNPKIKENNVPSCSLAEALQHQDLFINQAVSTWALHLLWTFFRTGRLLHHGYYINLETGHVRPIPVPMPVVEQSKLQMPSREFVRATRRLNRALPANRRRP